MGEARCGLVIAIPFLFVPKKVKGDSQVIPDGLFDGLGVLGAFNQSFPGVEVISGVKVAVGDVVILL